MSRLVAVLRFVGGSIVFRAVVTIVIVAIILTGIDWSTIARRLAGGSPGWGLLAVLAVDAALLLGALRWRRLLLLAEIRLRRRTVGRIYGVTSFANAFLPSSVGGDLARPWMVTRRGPVLVRTIATVLIERLAALVALLTLGWLGVLLAPQNVASIAVGALGLATGGLLSMGLLFIVRPRFLSALARRLLGQRFAGHLQELARVARGVAAVPSQAAAILGLSIAFQALVTMQLVLIARMIGTDLSFGLAAVALALVTLATLMPISIGGLGVREGSYILILAGGGIGHTDAVLISLLSVVVLFVATLPGGIELVRSGFAPAIDEPRG